MPVFAAIDIGSNSVRLKIARLERRKLKVLHEDREVTRLGESVFQSGILDPAAMEHTLRVLRRFHKATQVFGADTVRAVATSAIRDANNANAFTHWVAASTGWRVEVISGLEEGRLIHLGILSNSRVTSPTVLMIDLGGGSCELTVSRRGHIEEMFSLPLGAVRLTRDFLTQDPPKKEEIERLRGYIAEEIRRVYGRLSKHKIDEVIATSGTPAALSSAWSARQKRKSNTVPTEGLLKLTRQLSKLSVEHRRAEKGIGPKRAEIILAGAWVFSDLHSALKLKGFRYVPWGLRDGMLAQMAAEAQQADSSLAKRLASERQQSVHGMASHYQVDLRYAERVKTHSETLFHSLESLHHLTPEYLDLLRAGAMLEEVGSFISRVGRRRHAYYLISYSELLGYTQRQRRIIAALTRYIGKSRPTAESAPMRILPPADRLMVPRAVMLLRLARALEQGRRGVVIGTRTQLRQGRVVVTLQTKAAAELELWALEREKTYFREVFGREVEFRIS